ncbi:MAG: aminoglycoside phosphotransferase family protein [Acidimicrobiia bacterium]
MSPAPLDLAEVCSPSWLDDVLGARYPGVRVAATSVTEELVTIASKVRFAVEYEANPSGAPDALCVKGYFSPESASFASLGQVEVRFYSEVAPLLSVRVPPCVHTGIDPESGHGLILMEDLVAGGSTFLTALSPYTVDQTAATLEQLARLHTADRAAITATDTEWLAPRLAGYLGYVTEDRLQAQLDDGRADGLAPELRRADRLRAGLGVLADHSARAADCLVHGDAHAGNLYLDPDGGPGLIDWQVVQWGAWELDVAYHVGAVLAVADRDAHERALLDHYLDAVRAHGGTPPTEADAWEAYRRALVYGYFMWGITQRVERAVVETFVHRLGSAVQAHESLDRLGV